MYLGWDVGIKNLSYCLIDFTDNKYKIIDWGIINLIQDHLLPDRQCIEINKQGNKCTKKACFIDLNDNCYCKVHSKNHTNDNLKEYDNKRKCCHDECKSYATRFDEEFNYYCTKHVPKEKKELVEKICNKAAKTPLMQLGKKLFRELDNYQIFSKAEYVIIENQPVLKNPTMKSIQMMLYSYFLKKFIVDIDINKKVLKDIVLMSAKNKLKIYDYYEGPKLDHINKIKSSYSRNKKYAIEHTKFILDKTEQSDSFKEIFINSKKKDDLADSYLMTKYFIMKKQKKI